MIINKAEMPKKVQEAMTTEMRRIAARLPDGYGAALLVFNYSDSPGGAMHYMSTADREQMLKAMEELCANIRAEFGQ